MTSVFATAASALLTVGTLYRDSKDGNIPGQHVPEALPALRLLPTQRFNRFLEAPLNGQKTPFGDPGRR